MHASLHYVKTSAVLIKFDETSVTLVSDKLFEFLDRNLQKTPILFTNSFAIVRITSYTNNFLKCWLYDSSSYCTSGRDTLIVNVNGSRYADQTAVSVGFCLFSCPFCSFFLKTLSYQDLARSFFFLTLLMTPRFLLRILTKKQDSYQEFQEFSHRCNLV